MKFYVQLTCQSLSRSWKLEESLRVRMTLEHWSAELVDNFSRVNATLLTCTTSIITRQWIQLLEVSSSEKKSYNLIWCETSQLRLRNFSRSSTLTSITQMLSWIHLPIQILALQTPVTHHSKTTWMHSVAIKFIMRTNKLPQLKLSCLNQVQRIIIMKWQILWQSV